MWAVFMTSGSIGLVRLPLIILLIVFVFWMVVMIAIGPLMRLLTKCPRCGGVLLHPIFRRVTPTPDNCPHCGISLDEPMNS
jgi:ribosomal protein S27AE